MKRTIGEDMAVPAGAGDAAAGVVPEAARRPLRELMDDRLLDALLERSRDQAGGLRLTGEGSMLGELVRAVLERALESELTAHVGYEKGGRGGAGGNARNANIGETTSAVQSRSSSSKLARPYICRLSILSVTWNHRGVPLCADVVAHGSFTCRDGCGHGCDVDPRWPVLGRHERAAEWLRVWADLGRAPRTIDAYARGLAEYLQACERDGTDPLAASRAQMATFVRELASRPGARGANVLSIDSGAGLANATLQQRLVPVRLFYDYLVEEGVRESNPVGRGRYTPRSGFGGRRGLLPRMTRLPWIPGEQQWLDILEVARREPVRSRLMLALAYDAALRREELCSLQASDLDPAHRTLRVRAETTKNRRRADCRDDGAVLQRRGPGQDPPAQGTGEAGRLRRLPRRRSRSPCGPRPGAAARPPGSSRPASRSSASCSPRTRSTGCAQRRAWPAWPISTACPKALTPHLR
jgi:hypothetical protein